MVSKFGAKKGEKICGGISSRKTIFLPSGYQFTPMNCSQMIVNWLIGSVSENVSPIWILSSKEVTHINNGMIMWNIMKYFIYEVQRVDNEKVCWK